MSNLLTVGAPSRAEPATRIGHGDPCTDAGAALMAIADAEPSLPGQLEWLGADWSDRTPWVRMPLKPRKGRLRIAASLLQSSFRFLRRRSIAVYCVVV
jgi:hypothetical protein